MPGLLRPRPICASNRSASRLVFGPNTTSSTIAILPVIHIAIDPPGCEQFEKTPPDSPHQHATAKQHNLVQTYLMLYAVMVRSEFVQSDSFHLGYTLSRPSK